MSTGRLHRAWVHSMTVTAGLAAGLLWGGALPGAPAWGQSTIPPTLTQLRPIKGVAYDPRPSDFFQEAYFDSDFFNGDVTPSGVTTDGPAAAGTSTSSGTPA